METTNSNIPALRFPEFSGEWTESELKNLVDFLDGKRKPIKESDRANIKGIYPYYGASGIIDFVNDFIFDDELILLGEDGANIINRSSPLAFKVKGKIWVNNHAHVIKPKNKVSINFITEYLENLKYDKYNTGTAQPKLNKEVCTQIPIKYPDYKEQQKIGDFLTAVEDKLTQLKKKKTLIEQYKKGIMYQIFTQQLRFKDDEGNEFPEWEETTLGEVSTGIKSGKTKPEECGDIPVYGSTGIIGFTNQYSHNGDYILVARVGANAGKLALVNGKFGVTDNTLVIEVGKAIEIRYLYFLLMFSNLNKLVFGSGQPLITGGQLKAMSIFIPSISEQKLIATFLNNIDKKISFVQTQIGQTQNFKKGLLQQMFV